MYLAGPVTDPDGVELSSVDALGAGGEHQPGAILAAHPWTGRGSLAAVLPGGRLARLRHACSSSRRWEDARILAWDVGTTVMFRVSDIRGWTPGEESYIASFADLHP